jgi:hypothetical protein
VEGRREKRAMMEYAEEGRATILMRRGLAKFKLLTCEETKQTKKLLLTALHMFSNNTVFRCFGLWVDHVEEMKRMRKALAIFTNSLVARCFAKLAGYVEWRKQHRADLAAADEHLRLYRLSRAVTKFGWTVSEDRKNFKRAVARSLSWFVNGTMIRCFSTWVDWVGEMKRMRRAVGIFMNSLVIKCVRRWVDFVDEQKRLRGAIGIFMNSLVMRSIRRWVDFVEEQKRMRSALAIFTNSLVARCLRKWMVYADRRAEKRNREARGQEFWERKAKGKVLGKLEKVKLEGALWKIQLKGALGWMMNAALKKCFLNWTFWLEEQKKMR